MLVEISIDEEKLDTISRIYSKMANVPQSEIRANLKGSLKNSLNQNVDTILDAMQAKCQSDSEKLDAFKLQSANEIQALVLEQYEKLKRNDL